ncbi:MAG TPA: fluoride efflux transporter CrcB [Dictyobacter sp.]|jgi:CrcB protein|nr:fluoride efflux transporter CrcB [Dictyobacter sp.]
MDGAFFAQTVFIGLGGALGALARYTVGHLITQKVGSRFPYGTLTINVTGALVIAFIFGLVSHKVMSTTLQAILATGFLGGYTTFSTMSWEGVQLARGGSVRSSVLYLGGNVVLGLIAATVGILLGGLF